VLRSTEVHPEFFWFVDFPRGVGVGVGVGVGLK